MKRYFNFDFYASLFEALNIYFKVYIRLASIVNCKLTKDEAKIRQLKFMLIKMEAEVEKAQICVVKRNFNLPSEEEEIYSERVTAGPVKCHLFLN